MLGKPALALAGRRGLPEMALLRSAPLPDRDDGSARVRALAHGLRENRGTCGRHQTVRQNRALKMAGLAALGSTLARVARPRTQSGWRAGAARDFLLRKQNRLVLPSGAAMCFPMRLRAM